MKARPVRLKTMGREHELVKEKRGEGTKAEEET